MHRLFVAIRPPALVRDILLTMMEGVDGARWQDDGQLHLTVRFMGEVDARVAEDVASALGSLTCALPPIAVTGVGHFATRGRVTALWAGVAPAEPVARLHRKVDAALVRVGLPSEQRAFSPHITLARLNTSAANVAPWLARYGDMRSAAFAPTHLTLFESHLTAAGAQYDAVARYPLRRE